MVKIAYICDQSRHCNLYGACGKECTHTFDEFHTVNGIIHHVDELQTDRFRLVLATDECTYYEEVDGWQSNISVIDAEKQEEEESMHNCSQ